MESVGDSKFTRRRLGHTFVNVYDRLDTLGVCLSYPSCQRLLKLIGDHYKDEVVKAVKENKRFKLVGDNINWVTGVSEQRTDHTTKVHHAFGSMAVVQNVNFDHLPSDSPQQNYWEVNMKQYLMTEHEWMELRSNYVILIARVAKKLFPALARLPVKEIRGVLAEELKAQTKVVPLPVLFKNEQYYPDVVDIMKFYEEFIQSVFTEAQKDKAKVQTGGDQLTRERFSGAKRLMVNELTPEGRFEYLSPITNEFFHLLLNYLIAFFKQLYDSDSDQDVGTMKSEQTRLRRSNVDKDVRKAYSEDKDFTLSFINAYIAEAILDHFKITAIDSAIEAVPESDDELELWMQRELGSIVDKYVAPNMMETIHSWHNNQEQVQEDGHVLFLRIGDSRSVQEVIVPTQDKVKDYGHLVLEMGLLYMELLDMVKNPDRDRGIRVLKLAMVAFKSNNNLSKYANEILRFLVHQLTRLSEKEAHEEFYGLFVNTAGKFDSHIPADERMEYLVGSVKKHIKHMYSNQTESFVTAKSSALAGLHEISENFDRCSNVVVRSKKHTARSALEDEKLMITDLHVMRPFQFIPGRYHSRFRNVKGSLVEQINSCELLQWIHRKNHEFATEFGN